MGDEVENKMGTGKGSMEDRVWGMRVETDIIG